MKNDKGEQVSEKLEKQIKKDPTEIDYNEFFRNAFYGVFPIRIICLAFLYVQVKRI